MSEILTPLAKKLQIKPYSRVLCLPGEAQVAMVGPLPATTEDPAEADVALVIVTTPDEVEEFMEGFRHALAGTRAVWLLYPKGGAAPVNRDSIWAQVVGYEWQLVSNVSVDERWSALRTRPLKPGESVEIPG